MEESLTRDEERRIPVLVVEDDDETRRGIERLLLASGYCMQAEQNGEAAVERTRLSPPDLLLISAGTNRGTGIRMARQICTKSSLREHLPVVILGDADLEEGEERRFENNFYQTRPDNFDQLRGLIKRLLAETPRGH